MDLMQIKKNIRFSCNDILKLKKMGLVQRESISVSDGKNIILEDIPFAYARRINTYADIDVEVNSEWLSVTSGNDKELEKLYLLTFIETVKEKDVPRGTEEIAVDAPVEEVHEAIEESNMVEDVIEEAPVVEGPELESEVIKEQEVEEVQEEASIEVSEEQEVDSPEDVEKAYNDEAVVEEPTPVIEDVEAPEIPEEENPMFGDPSAFEKMNAPEPIEFAQEEIPVEEASVVEEPKLEVKPVIQPQNKQVNINKKKRHH